MKEKEVQHQHQYQYNEENNAETIDQIRDVYRSGAIEQTEINDLKESDRLEG